MSPPGRRAVREFFGLLGQTPSHTQIGENPAPLCDPWLVGILLVRQASRLHACHSAQSRQEGLKVPERQPKRGRLWLNDGSCIRLRPLYRGHVWSYDFVPRGRTTGVR